MALTDYMSLDIINKAVSSTKFYCLKDKQGLLYLHNHYILSNAATDNMLPKISQDKYVHICATTRIDRKYFH